MPGKVDGRGKVRAELEGVTLALVDVEEVLPEITLRIEQAIRRSGLTSLLDPALDDLVRISHAVCDAKMQVNVAMVTLMDKK
jgi:hypothetical protein